MLKGEYNKRKGYIFMYFVCILYCLCLHCERGILMKSTPSKDVLRVPWHPLQYSMKLTEVVEGVECHDC